jgi:hypothetical protein
MLANAPRTGIELSPSLCTLAVADRAGAPRGGRPVLRVRKFATFTNIDNTVVLVADLREMVDSHAVPKHAWITLWGARHVHRYTWVARQREKEAREVALEQGESALGLDRRDLEAAFVRGANLLRGEKVELSFVASASSDIRKKVALVEAAGFVVDGVTTASGALWAQARLRPGIVPTDVHAYVAIGASRSALAIISNGFMLYGREMPWGYARPGEVFPVARSRFEVATELAGELRRSFLYVKQYCDEDVSQVLLCGEMPEIRSLTGPLIERIGIEVETLDTLEGVDAAHLPEPGDVFADRVASMRLAMAVSASGAPVNLLPIDQTVVHRRRLRRSAVAIGSVAAVGAAALVYERNMWTERPRYVEHQSAAVLPRPEPLPKVAEPSQDSLRATQEATTGRSEPVRSTLPASAAPATRVAPRAVPHQPQPDPIVRTILYSPQRQVAVVDGQIVGPGDHLGDGVIEAIEPRAVVYVTGDGVVKRLPLDDPGNLTRVP